jgi:signal transduction histidine kinase
VPEIPVAGFLLEALGAVAVALMLSSFQRTRPRAGVRDWSLGLWFQAAGLVASVAVGTVRAPWLRTAVLAVAMVLAYWSPALVLLGTWCRWHDREYPGARRALMAALGTLALATTFAAPLAGPWGFLLRAGTFALSSAIANVVAGVLLLLRGRGVGSWFGPRVLAVAFLGGAAEDALFFAIAATAGQLRAVPSASVLIEGELVLLMLTGVGMVAWLLEGERESAVRLQEALHRREALSAMGTLVGGVAHEVRNPLFGISAMLDALGVRLAGDRGVAPLLATMREQVQRLSRLMAELLDYGRPIATDLTRQSLSAAVARSIASCAALSEQAGVRLELELEGEPCRDAAPMDEPRLQQVFQNLVQNAVEHTPREGRVRLEVRPERRCGRAGVLCAVHDSGPGFDPAHLPRVFEPFFSHRPGGTGLGLSVVQRIVEQHSGHVEAANHPEGGAVVTVWLPAEPPRP